MSSFSEMRISWAAARSPLRRSGERRWSSPRRMSVVLRLPGHAATLLRANGVGNGGLYEAGEQRAGGDFGFLRMSTTASNPPAAYGSRAFAPLLESRRRARVPAPRWV